MAKSNDPIVYEIGHIKRNPETQAVAVKTIFSDTDPALSDLAQWSIHLNRWCLAQAMQSVCFRLLVCSN